MKRTPDEYAKRAHDLFLQGYNCSQAVVLAFDDTIGIDRGAAARLASSFGGGMGRLREVCGAVSGMFMVAGLVCGYDDPEIPALKAEHYASIQSLAAEFKKENQSIICRELLGLPGGASTPSPSPRTDSYYKKRPCAELVEQAAKIVAEFFESEEIKQKQ